MEEKKKNANDPHTFSLDHVCSGGRIMRRVHYSRLGFCHCSLSLSLFSIRTSGWWLVGRLVYFSFVENLLFVPCSAQLHSPTKRIWVPVAFLSAGVDRFRAQASTPDIPLGIEMTHNQHISENGEALLLRTVRKRIQSNGAGIKIKRFC